MLDQVTSLRLNLLRFPLIVGVVFIHNYSSNVTTFQGVIGTTENNFIVDFVRDLISGGIAGIAAPIFFIMSGYLFFINYDGTLNQFISKVTVRLRTLFVPFMFWNLAVLLLIAVGQYLPQTKGFFNAGNFPVREYGIFDYINSIIGITRAPISYQFWFIRDLFVLVLISPLLRIVYVFSDLLFLMMIFICWICDFWPDYYLSVSAVLFFLSAR